MGLAFCGKCGAIIDGACLKCSLTGQWVKVQVDGVTVDGVIGRAVHFRGHDVYRVAYDALVPETLLRCGETLKQHLASGEPIIARQQIDEEPLAIQVPIAAVTAWRPNETPTLRENPVELPESAPCVAQCPRDSVGEGGEGLQESIQPAGGVPALEGAA